MVTQNVRDRRSAKPLVTLSIGAIRSSLSMDFLTQWRGTGIRDVIAGVDAIGVG